MTPFMLDEFNKYMKQQLTLLSNDRYEKKLAALQSNKSKGNK